jgi:dienelactone hydrolase
VLAHEGTYPVLYGSYDLPVGSGHSPGYLARPDQAGRFPTVLVLPEAGLTSHHKDLCRRLARRGLAAVAVDLALAGGAAAAVFVGEASEFVTSADVTWAIENQLGIIGLGAGGEAGLIYATDHPEIRAVVLVSTALDQTSSAANALPRLVVPVLGLFGADDMSGSAVDDGCIPQGSFVVYQGVGGGFLDDGSAEYDAAAAADAFRRLVEFLSRALPEARIERLG